MPDDVHDDQQKTVCGLISGLRGGMDAHIQDALSKRIDHVLWWKSWGIFLWVTIASLPLLVLASFAAWAPNSHIIAPANITILHGSTIVLLLCLRAWLCSRAVQKTLVVDRVTSAIISGLDFVIFVSAFAPIWTWWGYVRYGIFLQ
jgi:hypothetical protein